MTASRILVRNDFTDLLSLEIKYLDKMKKAIISNTKSSIKLNLRSIFSTRMNNSSKVCQLFGPNNFKIKKDFLSTTSIHC